MTWNVPSADYACRSLELVNFSENLVACITELALSVCKEWYRILSRDSTVFRAVKTLEGLSLKDIYQPMIRVDAVPVDSQIYLTDSAHDGQVLSVHLLSSSGSARSILRRTVLLGRHPTRSTSHHVDVLKPHLKVCERMPK